LIYVVGIDGEAAAVNAAELAAEIRVLREKLAEANERLVNAENRLIETGARLVGMTEKAIQLEQDLADEKQAHEDYTHQVYEAGMLIEAAILKRIVDDLADVKAENSRLRRLVAGDSGESFRVDQRFPVIQPFPPAAR
jgi:hypothetical protein